jgi:hypothetical protein
MRVRVDAYINVCLFLCVLIDILLSYHVTILTPPLMTTKIYNATSLISWKQKYLYIGLLLS